MAKSKKNTKKPSVKVRDMKAKKDPKGGATDYFLKIDSLKAQALKAPTTTLSTSTLSSSDLLKVHK